VSRDIEPSFISILQNTSLASYTSAMGYESERSYFLSTVGDSDDTEATQTFVYNTFTKTWVKHTYAFVAGMVEPAVDKMYFAKPGVAKIYAERKSFTDADFADPESAITIDVIDTDNDTVDFTLTGVVPEAGWTISQGNDEVPIRSLLVLTATTYRATLESAVPTDWTVAAATIYPPVGMDVEWHPYTAGGPDVLKQTSHVSILSDDSLGDASATAITVKVKSNYQPEMEEVDVLRAAGGWGTAEWGSSAWGGGGGGDPVGFPTLIPREMSYNTRLTIGVRHKYARQKLVCAGYALVFTSASERIGRE
jgi:hypothetical protein